MAMANSLAPSEDERTRARAIGGTLLGGHCGAALEGVSCVRATDCRLCSFFRIHPDRREVFVQDYERALFEADILEEEEGRRRDAENRRQFAALNLAVIDRIDEFLEGAR